jgi:hypothetical protein
MSPKVLCFDCGGTFNVEYGVANPTEQCPKCNTEEISSELEKYLIRHLKRTGIFRMYQLDRETHTTRLLLEFAIRGKVLGRLYLWKRRHSIFEGE